MALRVAISKQEFDRSLSRRKRGKVIPRRRHRFAPSKGSSIRAIEGAFCHEAG